MSSEAASFGTATPASAGVAVPLEVAAPVVRSYNEWDPLEEVVIGTALGAVRSAYEPAVAPFIPLGDPERDFGGGRYSREEMERAQEQLDGFAKLLEDRGIVVRRPDPVDHAFQVRTPDFECSFGHAQTCPRDVLLVVGEEIIEAPMAQRSRYFESRAYRSLLKEYFLGGARWTAAPKTTMADGLYVSNYETASAPYDFSSHPSLTELEICFDAASFSRMGRDVFWQPDIVSNRLGAEWLQRHLGEEFRVHRVEFEDRHPHHIDATFVPLRPGLALTNPERPPKHGCLRLFEQNDWQLIDAVPSARPKRSASVEEPSSWISMNILSLDQRTVVIEDAEQPFGELLSSHGFEVLTCPFDAVYKFGGSFHCCSLDVRRRGELESYFPSLEA
jgi:glycine amidinotransferase